MNEEQSFKRGLQWLSGVVVLAFVVVCIVIWNQGQPRGADEFLIPEGYHGEIVISYGVSGAPELVKKSGFYENAIQADGTLETSTKNESSFPRGEDRFYYVDAQGNKSEIYRDQQVWDGFLKEKSGGPITGHLFIGTKDEYEKWSMELKEIEDKEKKTIRTGM